MARPYIPEKPETDKITIVLALDPEAKDGKWVYELSYSVGKSRRFVCTGPAKDVMEACEEAVAVAERYVTLPSYGGKDA